MAPVTSFTTDTDIVSDYTPTGGHIMRPIPSNILPLQGALCNNKVIHTKHILLNTFVERSFESCGLILAFVERVLEEFNKLR